MKSCLHSKILLLFHFFFLYSYALWQLLKWIIIVIIFFSLWNGW